MQQIRFIISDLDGTLLSESHHLTPQVCEAVQKYKLNGGWFTFATGRPYITVKPIAEKLGIEIPFICCNGSVVAERQRILSVNHLPMKDLEDLIIQADKHGLTVLVFRDKQIDAVRRTDAVDRFEIKEDIQCQIAGSPDLLPKKKIHKMLLIGDMKLILRLWSFYASRIQQQYAAFQSEPDFLEIIPPNQSKGKAMLELMSQLNVSMKEVMAIGNQLNDLDMIKMAGVGVAVANSPDELKIHADYVCKKSYGDGVVEAIQKFTDGHTSYSQAENNCG